MPEKEVSGAALKWWDEHMDSYAHNFHFTLYYGISSCKLLGYGEEGVNPFPLISKERAKLHWNHHSSIGWGALAQ
jgi:hypothetical protein